jgi:hypothetical protein
VSWRTVAATGAGAAVPGGVGRATGGFNTTPVRTALTSAASDLSGTAVERGIAGENPLSWTTVLAATTTGSTHLITPIRANFDPTPTIPKPTSIAPDDFVNLASPARTTHILDGEMLPNGRANGGHRAGTGYPEKSEFPAAWSDPQVMHYISDVATDPSLVWRAGRRGDRFVVGTRDGIDIRVLIRNNEIWAAYPINVALNPSAPL